MIKLIEKTNIARKDTLQQRKLGFTSNLYTFTKLAVVPKIKMVTFIKTKQNIHDKDLTHTSCPAKVRRKQALKALCDLATLREINFKQMKMSRPYLLAENNWKFIKDNEFDLAVLPWGATEAHNYHLPYGTDVYESDYLSAEAARIAWEKGARIIVLPPIPFGVNTGQKDIKLDINLNPSTQRTILDDIIHVLDYQKINKFIVFNSHGGNDFKPMLRELGLKFPGMFLAFCNWYQSIDFSDYFDETEGDHANEMETSLMMYLKPELVLPLNEAGDGKVKKFSVQALNEKWAWTERQWSKVTQDTGVGNPKHANATRGKQYFDAVTKKVASFFYDIAVTPVDQMYIDSSE